MTTARAGMNQTSSMRLLPLLAASVSVGVAILAGSLSAAKAKDEVATLPDGRRLTGSLALDESSRLRFTPAGKAALSLDAIQHVRFPGAAVPPLRVAAAHRVLLPNDQSLTGELLGLDEKTLRLRSDWSGPLSLPRPAVVAVTHLPGLVTFFVEDFEAEPKSWKLTGAPGFSGQHTSGKRGLLLSAPGQAAEHSLAAPLEAGRVGVNFLDEGAAGAGWRVEAEFEGKEGPRPVPVSLAGDGNAYQVEVPGSESRFEPVRRTAGWHRLELGFRAGSLRVTVDDAVLWFSLKQGPGGPLRRVRLTCTAADKATLLGHVVVADSRLARTMDEPRRPQGDPTQDEVWLLAADQLFGQIVRADGRFVELRAGPRALTLAWGDVRGLFPRRSALPPQTTDGEHVRLWLRSGAGPEADQLEGVLLAFDDRRLALHHLVLGKLEIERARVQQLRGLFHGRRIELDNDCHHLGDKDRVVSALRPARAEGTSLRRTFRLDAVPKEARLVIHVANLKGADGGAEAARKHGEPLTEVLLNGRHVDYLNRFVDRPLPGPQRLSLALPCDALHKGENVIEVRTLPGKEGGRCENCGVSGMAVEVPR